MSSTYEAATPTGKGWARCRTETVRGVPPQGEGGGGGGGGGLLPRNLTGTEWYEGMLGMRKPSLQRYEERRRVNGEV
jgi:hypothetical protein